MAEVALDNFRTKWDDIYPTIGEIWIRNWQGIIPFLAFPDYIRRAIYTTHAIEAVNRQIRKIIKSKVASLMVRQFSNWYFYVCKMEKKDGQCPSGKGNWHLTNLPSCFLSHLIS